MELPVLEATVCFLRRDGKTAFIDYTTYDHPLHKGYYSPPGGKLKDGETKEDCVKREILEEQNIRINNLVYRGEVLFNNERRHFGGKPAKWSFRVYYFESSDFDDSGSRATEGRLSWVSDESVPELPMHEGDKVIWDWLRRHDEIKAEIVHEEERLTAANLIL